jgi:N-acetylmuramoyl-L-alanine amidase
VQTGLVKAAAVANVKAKDLGVKPSLFYVLLGARMPAILIETGFMSNAREGRLLMGDAYQQALAAAIADAVSAHLKEPRTAAE